MNLFTSIAIKENIKPDKCPRWAGHLNGMKAVTSRNESRHVTSASVLKRDV